MKTLYLIRGVPGSGKSSLANELWENNVVDAAIEADDFFMKNGKYEFDATKLHEAHKYCQQNTHNFLRNGYSVAVSNTSTTEKEVKVYQDIAKQHGAKFISIIVENRHGGVNQHNVPEEKIQQMKDRFSIKL